VPRQNSSTKCRDLTSYLAICVIDDLKRVRLAVQQRGASDYIFGYWSALGRTVLTFGIYGFYVFYQLVRRMRDHNARRLELLDAATTVAWEQAGRQGLQQELAPSFQRAAAHLAVLRQMTADFRLWSTAGSASTCVIPIRTG
jgi:hypothetical protein